MRLAVERADHDSHLYRHFMHSSLRARHASAQALVNGVHCLQQLPPSDKQARQRLERVEKLGVSAKLWSTWLQRPPHLAPGLSARPWWNASEFGWCALLERHHRAIRDEVLALRVNPTNFTPVGGRAAHDHTLVAAVRRRRSNAGQTQALSRYAPTMLTPRLDF